MSKRGQLQRLLMLFESLVDAAVHGFNTSPDFEPGETKQNIVEIETVRELVFCFFSFGTVLRFRLWSGSTPNSQVVTCGVEFHVNSNSSCVSAYFPAQLAPLFVFVTLWTMHAC